MDKLWITISESNDNIDDSFKSVAAVRVIENNNDNDVDVDVKGYEDDSDDAKTGTFVTIKYI